MSNFWQDLKNKKANEPIMVLAPMADVTDAAFRKVIAKYGKPDVLWTEFVSADGLCLAPTEGQKGLREAFKYSEEERPIVAQLFGSNPENMKNASKLVEDLGFDGVDINMGCPEKNVNKQGSGAAMVKTPGLAREIIYAAKEGVKNIPVSVKIRLGYNHDELDTWLPNLLETNPAVVTIHARTRKEMSKVPAKWNRVADAVKIRDDLNSDSLIFGNGDVFSLEQARSRAIETGCDGVMIGRGIFGNPWFFSSKVPTTEEKLNVLVEHTKLFEELIEYKSFSVMKKHFKAYVEGFDGAKELRVKLMETENAEEVEKEIKTFLKTWA